MNNRLKSFWITMIIIQPLWIAGVFILNESDKLNQAVGLYWLICGGMGLFTYYVFLNHVFGEEE